MPDIWAGDPSDQRNLPCIPPHYHRLRLHFHSQDVDDGGGDDEEEEEEEEDGETRDEKGDGGDDGGDDEGEGGNLGPIMPGS